MNKLRSLALEQKENAKHGEAFFPVQKYITKLNSDETHRFLTSVLPG